MIQVAKIILINEKNQFLMPLRDNKPEIVYPNRWAEIGGGIEENETPLEAIKREIKEEISCEVFNIKQIGEMIDPVTPARMIMFKGNFSEKLENIKLYEGQRLGLFTFEELKNLLMPPPLRKFLLEHKKEILSV